MTTRYRKALKATLYARFKGEGESLHAAYGYLLSTHGDIKVVSLCKHLDESKVDLFVLDVNAPSQVPIQFRLPAPAGPKGSYLSLLANYDDIHSAVHSILDLRIDGFYRPKHPAILGIQSKDGGCIDVTRAFLTLDLKEVCKMFAEKSREVMSKRLFPTHSEYSSFLYCIDVFEEDVVNAVDLYNGVFSMDRSIKSLSSGEWALFQRNLLNIRQERSSVVRSCSPALASDDLMLTATPSKRAGIATRRRDALSSHPS